MCEACVINVVSNLVSKLGEYLFDPIGRQFGYVLCYKCYVEDLENGVKDLERERKRAQSSIDEAVYDGKCIYEDVENWLKSVKEETDKAANLLNRGKSAKDACFRGWLPNPVVRHPIGREVKKITKVIQGLHEKNPNDKKVYFENPPIGIVPPNLSPKRFVGKKEDVLESRAKITEKVMKAIVDDKVCVIGVYGPGGVGKSMLLKDVERRVKEEKLFNAVVRANVSRNPSRKEIQDQIAYALGLKLTNDESAIVRADRLRRRLENAPEKNILIILDDLWDKLELKDVGIPCGEGNKVRRCKLLLASRNRDVLRTHMSSDREFQLNVLELGEARRLFERIVGDKVNNPEFEQCIDGAVENCGGLPLSIVSLANRLKQRDLAAWWNASTNRDLSDVKSLVKLSYEELKDETIKSLFLVCPLTSGRIFTRDSLIYCMGLGLFKEFGKNIQNMRYRLIEGLRSLQDSSLLLESDDMEHFRMHDIFVDVAISMHDKFMDTEWNALVGKEDYGFEEWSKDELRKCTAISFCFVGIDELPEKLNCPNLRMLLLFEDNPSLKIPESFFESMKKLQVLDLTGLSFTTLPPSIEFLENLKSLSLDQCDLENVTVLGKLKGLQFLSLFGSTIARLPNEIGELTKLRLLDLRDCFGLKIIEPGMLESLVNLEELYIDSFDEWEAEDEAPRSNARLAELKSMKKLRTLYITIPHSTHLSSDLPFGNLNEHKIQIGDTVYWWDSAKESRALKLKLDSDNLLHEVWMQECLGRTQDLRLDGLQDSRDSIHDLCAKGFQELKHLHVKNNHSFQYVVDSTQCPAFTRLESLVLENLNYLEKIYRDCLAPKSFSELKIVKVENCGEIKHLFPSSMTRIFLQLEEIEITTCHLMQRIVTDAEADEYIARIDDDANVKSCKLRRLMLQNLPEMTSFCKTEDHSIVFFNGQQVSLPWLESLTLSKLPKLKEIWNSQFPSDVSNLKFLKVKDCAFLLSIIPSNLLIKLQNLEAITVKGCQLIHEVFDLGGVTPSEDVEILSRLTKLTLSDLPRLEHLWNKNPRKVLCFRNLSALKVQNCENLRFLFSSPMAKALWQIKEIKIANCKLLEEIFYVRGEESEESASIDTLEFPLLTSLSLEELPNLRRFSYGTYGIHCPTLTRLRIFGCPKMMTFSSFEGKQQSMTADTGLQQALGRINSSLSLPVFFNQNVLFPSLEELTLVSCGLMKIWHNELSEESFCKLASITVRDCENLSHIFPSTLIERFLSLKMIEVVDCISLEALMEHVAVNTKKRQRRLVFLELKEVELRDLPRLNALVSSSTKVTLSLPSLTNVSLCNCHSLRYLFTNDTVKTLDKLEILIVFGCKNMQEVIATEESEERKLKAVKFSHLHTLRLCSLKSLISFSSGSCAYEFPSLRNLSILECTELKAFIRRLPTPSVEMMNEGSAVFNERPHSLFDKKVEFPSMETMKISHMDNVEKIWLDELASTAFSKLQKLTVEYCEKLSSIFPSNTFLMRFQNLEELKVTDCDSLEVLFQIQEVNMSEAHSTRTFQLRKLELKRLPKMKYIWSGHPGGTLTFECLQCLEVENCESLKSLFPVSVAKSMTQLEELLVWKCGVEEIIAAEDGVGTSAGDLFFPQLTDLRLLELPELRRFYKNSQTSTWPLLKQLRVRHCGKMRPFSFSKTTDETQHALFSFEKVISQLEGSILTREDVMTMQQHCIFDNLKELSLACYHDENAAFPSDFLLQRFPNLEKLIVICSSFEEIFPEDASGYGGASLKALGNLKQLRLHKLCNLRQVCEDGSLMAEILKQIEFLYVCQCPKLSIVLPSSTSFQSLRQLVVEDCASLVHMGTCSVMTSLVHLTWLTLRNCGAMKDVVTDDANGTEEISFPELEELILDGLPSLESFSPTNCAFDFPSLERVVVTQCPKINIFCEGPLRTPNLDKVLPSDGDGEGRWQGDLNATIRTLSA